MDATRHSRISLPTDAVHDFAARRLDAADGCSSGKHKLCCAMCELSWRQLGHRLTKNAAALKDFAGADEKPGTHIPRCLYRHIEFHLAISRIGSSTTKVLGNS